MTDVTILHHPRGEVEVAGALGGERRVSVRMADPGEFVLRAGCTTSYPDELLREVLDFVGPAFLCDQIARDESWDYIGARLEDALLGYLAPERFRGARLLDFGCGGGASTVNLARLFPDAAILGVEVNPNALGVARHLAEHHGFGLVSFRLLGDPDSLPDDLGTFDFVVMNAVYEHLSPHERTTLMPMLWSLLRPGGVLFLNETPYRWFPWELHTSGLPVVNFLPDRIAGWAARRFSPRCRDLDWDMLLKAGFRGAAVREIVTRIGESDPNSVVLLRPCRRGFRDRIDIALATPSAAKLTPWQREALRFVARAVERATGWALTPTLALAIERRR